MSSRQACGKNADTNGGNIEKALNTTNELTKCLVREMFHFSTQVIDGLSASLLHIASSEDSRSVHCHPQARNALHLNTDRHIMNDKLLEIYLKSICFHRLTLLKRFGFLSQTKKTSYKVSLIKLLFLK